MNNVLPPEKKRKSVEELAEQEYQLLISQEGPSFPEDPVKSPDLEKFVYIPDLEMYVSKKVIYHNTGLMNLHHVLYIQITHR